jgi:uncharacterized protein YkwD
MKLFRQSGLILLAAAACAAPGVPAQAGYSSPAMATIAEQYLLSAANQERTARGLSELHRDVKLAHAAANHAEQMAEHRSISHQFPGEAELTDRGASAGVAFSTISENVAQAPSVLQIHDMWMHSEHHRANLLDPTVDSVGISVIQRGGELYAVEDFAKTVRAVSLEAQESAIAGLVAQAGPIAFDWSAASISAARQTCAMGTGYAGDRKPWFVMRFTSGSLTQLPDQLKTLVASGKYRQATVGACDVKQRPFTAYNFAVLLYP